MYRIERNCEICGVRFCYSCTIVAGRKRKRCSKCENSYVVERRRINERARYRRAHPIVKYVRASDEKVAEDWLKVPVERMGIKAALSMIDSWMRE